jgi:hypothetical protein
MGATTQAYIIAARITQGHEAWEASTATERQSIIENYLKIKDDPSLKKRHGHGHGHTELNHVHRHNASQSSIESQATIPAIEHKHHGHAHSIRNHFSHHKDSGNESGADTDNSSPDAEKHKHHSHKIHLPHFHKHDSKSELELSHSATVVPILNKETQMVHESDVRKVITID